VRIASSAYLRYYNRKRPHAGCGALTPMKKLERTA
jgi:transposase InsO family protein